jgi:hypothetical protein
MNSVPKRLNNHEKPELNTDFVRYPYGNSPVRIIGYWKIHHGYDYGPEALDYEDHSMTLLHQRPSHYRSFWVVFLATTSICIWYYTWLEFPFPGTFFGQSYMDLKMNGIKYLNNDEEYHNWNSMLSEFNAKLKAAEDAENADDEEPADTPAESDLEEVTPEE